MSANNIHSILYNLLNCIVERDYDHHTDPQGYCAAITALLSASKPIPREDRKLALHQISTGCGGSMLEKQGLRNTVQEFDFILEEAFGNGTDEKKPRLTNLLLAHPQWCELLSAEGNGAFLRGIMMNHCWYGASKPLNEPNSRLLQQFNEENNDSIWEWMKKSWNMAASNEESQACAREFVASPYYTRYPLMAWKYDFPALETINA